MSARRVVLAGAVATLVLGGATVAQAAPLASAHRPAVTISVGKGNVVRLPSRLAPGVVRLDNRSESQLAVVQAVRRGDSVRQFVRLASNRNTPAGRLAAGYHVIAYIGVRGVGGSDYVNLRRGAVYVYALAGKLSARRVSVVRVTGARRTSAVPASSPFTVNGDGSLTSPGSFTSGHWIRISCQHAAYGSIVGFRVGSRTDEGTLADFVAHPSYSKLDHLDITAVRQLETPLAGTYVTRFSAPRGRWIFLSFRQRAGGATLPLRPGDVRRTTIG